MDFPKFFWTVLANYFAGLVRSLQSAPPSPLTALSRRWMTRCLRPAPASTFATRSLPIPRSASDRRLPMRWIEITASASEPSLVPCTVALPHCVVLSDELGRRTGLCRHFPRPFIRIQVALRPTKTTSVCGLSILDSWRSSRGAIQGTTEHRGGAPGDGRLGPQWLQ
jgi:hypothetical protein